MSTESEAYTDVVELCALLQCLGFSVKSVDLSDCNVSQDGDPRTVAVDCQTSGLHVVLENTSTACSCPVTNKENSGVWQVSGVTKGKHLDKEFGCSLLGSLPKSYQDRLAKQLRDMIFRIKELNISDTHQNKETHKILGNKSASMIEMETPKKLHHLTPETPTRYRSLDTLTTNKDDDELTMPRPLAKLNSDNCTKDENTQKMCGRQSTYTLSTTDTMRQRNKTSSPIQNQMPGLYESLVAAVKVSEDLRDTLRSIVKDFTDERRNDSSMSSLALDFSKISILKGEPSRAQFASSPNLSGPGIVFEDTNKSKLKRFESASTSNLVPNKSVPGSDSKISRIRKFSPNILKLKCDRQSVKGDKPKVQESKGRLSGLFKPKIAVPVRSPRANLEASPNLSASRKKFSHIKSTIPRPNSKKE